MVTEEKKRIRKQWAAVLAAAVITVGALIWHYRFDPWGYYWKVSDVEMAVRGRILRTAESYLGTNEADGSHAKVIDLYNSHEPLAVDYRVKYTDSWCSTFVSAVSIRCGMTQIIPTECGCERHIGLFQELGRWEEDESVIPLPGDIIFYDWDQTTPGDSTGWADHVGIVVGTKWPFLKVIEGNKDDSVSYRILPLWDNRIRGYAKPDYSGLFN